MTFKLNEIVFFDNPDPAYAKQQGIELRIIGLEGAYPAASGNHMLFGYQTRDIITGQIWIVKEHSLRRTKLDRGDMDTPVSWYSFGLATGWHKRPEDLT